MPISSDVKASGLKRKLLATPSERQVEGIAASGHRGSAPANPQGRSALRSNGGQLQEMPPPHPPVHPYTGFDELDGSHPFQRLLPEGYVTYQVRSRKGAKVGYFNFELAKEMGLLPPDHPHHLPQSLKRKICETFAIQIINEYDIQHGLKVPQSQIRKNRYMATRYLQLQHPDKKGLSSGDGRGVWNGSITRNGVTWDVTSSGTGATRLSPATVIEGRYFKTGDRNVGYGDGYNRVDDGLSTALMSEIFASHGIGTERTLAILHFEGGTSINVRAGLNLLRPSHLFLYLKQGRSAALQRAVDLLIEREISNGRWPRTLLLMPDLQKYTFVAQAMAERFAATTALFRDDYIFCWLDWDGDNILCDAGIIDYGSVRRFGAYHHGYRYDDVDRYSTNLEEQRRKGREIVRTFVQIRDFLCTGEKRPIAQVDGDPILLQYDSIFEREFRHRRLLRAGFSSEQALILEGQYPALTQQFLDQVRRLELIQTRRGVYSVADGVSSDPWINLRRLLARLPEELLLQITERSTLFRFGAQTAQSLFGHSKTHYCGRRDQKLTSKQKQLLNSVLRSYLEMATHLASRRNIRLQILLRQLAIRAKNRNPITQVTGDGILTVTQLFLSQHKRGNIRSLQTVVDAFFDLTCGSARAGKLRRPSKTPALTSSEKKILDRAIAILTSLSEGF